MKKSLRELRAARGLTQMELAVRLGVGLATVGNWETLRTCPSPPMIEKLASFYGVPASELELAPYRAHGRTYDANLVEVSA